MKHYNFLALKQKMFNWSEIGYCCGFFIATPVCQKTNHDQSKHLEVSEAIAKYLESNLNEINLDKIVEQHRVYAKHDHVKVNFRYLWSQKVILSLLILVSFHYFAICF